MFVDISGVAIYVCPGVTDMRKAINGLSGDTVNFGGWASLQTSSSCCPRVILCRPFSASVMSLNAIAMVVALVPIPLIL